MELGLWTMDDLLWLGTNLDRGWSCWKAVGAGWRKIAGKYLSVSARWPWKEILLAIWSVFRPNLRKNPQVTDRIFQASASKYDTIYFQPFQTMKLYDRELFEIEILFEWYFMCLWCLCCCYHDIKLRERRPRSLRSDWGIAPKPTGNPSYSK